MGVADMTGAGGFDPWTAGATFAGQAMGGTTKSSADSPFQQTQAFDNAFNVTFGNASGIATTKPPLIPSTLPNWQTLAGLAVAGLALLMIIKRMKK